MQKLKTNYRIWNYFIKKSTILLKSCWKQGEVRLWYTELKKIKFKCWIEINLNELLIHCSREWKKLKKKINKNKNNNENNQFDTKVINLNLVVVGKVNKI